MSMSPVLEIAKNARKASRLLQKSTGFQRDAALRFMAEKFLGHKQNIMEANRKDLEKAGKQGLSGPMLKRLELSENVFEYMHSRLVKVAELADPVGKVIEGHREASGLAVEKISVPLGVVAMIYESRPNVTTDAVSVCLKSGNAVILRGGSESILTNTAIEKALREGLKKSELPGDSIQMILSGNHEDVDVLLGLNQYIDVLIPRGGKGLIKAVSEKSSIPVIKHYDGICHLYIAPDANISQAVALAINSKCQKVEVCNALETLLIDEKIASEILPVLKQEFDRRNVELLACEKTRQIIPELNTATDEDWSTEYLAPVLSVKIVKDQEEAHEHIACYGSSHTDSIATESIDRAEKFIQNVDSASVMINASTRLSGGNDYGQGAVIGISTDKLHARGPVGPADLTSYKWIVRGNGHLRS